jgi:hypothetical protein
MGLGSLTLTAGSAPDALSCRRCGAATSPLGEEREWWWPIETTTAGEPITDPPEGAVVCVGCVGVSELTDALGTLMVARADTVAGFADLESPDAIEAQAELAAVVRAAGQWHEAAHG